MKPSTYGWIGFWNIALSAINSFAMQWTSPLREETDWNSLEGMAISTPKGPGNIYDSELRTRRDIFEEETY